MIGVSEILDFEVGEVLHDLGGVVASERDHENGDLLPRRQLIGSEFSPRLFHLLSLLHCPPRPLGERISTDPCKNSRSAVPSVTNPVHPTVCFLSGWPYVSEPPSDSLFRMAKWPVKAGSQRGWAGLLSAAISQEECNLTLDEILWSRFRVRPGRDWRSRDGNQDFQSDHYYLALDEGPIYIVTSYKN